ncbi:MAG: PhnD/SsuA/transferrin family substrate-binding protein [Phycisphaeraceae bacterium]|nr:PhnD/SsuA/transferrin family substrate-binding protein [Phycisphaeraceae bacterium]
MMQVQRRSVSRDRRSSAFPFLVVLVAMIAGLAACTETNVDADGRPLRLRFADSGIEGMEELALRYGLMAEEFKRILGVEIQFFSLSGRGLATLALDGKDVDLALVGPSEYVAIRNRVAVEPVIGLERPRYFTVFVVPENHPARSLEDLKPDRLGRRAVIGFKDHGSTTGHVMPGYMLIEAGLNLDRDVRISFLGGTRVEAMLTGDIDVLAAGIRDYDELVRRAGEGRFRILAQSPPMPKDLLVIRPGFDPRFVEELRQSLLEHGDSILEAMLEPGRSPRYVGSSIVPVQDEDYQIVRDAYRALGLPVSE